MYVLQKRALFPSTEKDWLTGSSIHILWMSVFLPGSFYIIIKIEEY